MLTIKLTADNVRMLRNVKTAPEALGCIGMILERIEQSETLKTFGREPKPDRNSTWQHAKNVIEYIVGPGNLTYPVAPDSTYYQGLYRTIRQYGMDEALFKRLGEHAKEHMELPVALDFLIRQHARVLAGHWDIPAWKRRNKAEAAKVASGEPVRVSLPALPTE